MEYQCVMRANLSWKGEQTNRAPATQASPVENISMHLVTFHFEADGFLMLQ